MKNFIDLSLDEHKKILKWRNSEYVSKWMINKHISLDEHLNFVKSLKNSNKLYFLVDDIGVIYFILKDDYAEIGLYKNPDKNRVGKILMKKIIDYGFNHLKLDKLILYVFEDNKKAISLYEKFGFQQIDKRENIIKMELKK